MKQNRQATFLEMKEAVTEGLKQAHSVVDTTDLDDFLNTLEEAWEKVAGDFLIVGISLASLKYKNKPQTIKMLERYMKVFNQQKARQPIKWLDECVGMIQ